MWVVDARYPTLPRTAASATFHTVAILYDSLLVQYLARELDDRLRARRLRRVRLDPENRRFVLELDDHRLVWELHATRGWIRVLDGGSGDDAEQAAAEGWGGRRVPTQRRPRVRSIDAPPDERWIDIVIDAGGPDRASRFVVELITNQWNVLALAPDGRIVAALRPREAGGRRLVVGAPYAHPAAPVPREGIEEPVSPERFRAILADGADPARSLVRSLAWTSTLNAGAILGGSDGDTEGAPPDLDAAWRRYRALALRPESRPRVIHARGRIQPYPLPLDGVGGEPAGTLLEAFTASVEEATDVTAAVAPEVRAALEDRLERVASRARRLREEAETAPERAAHLRRRADLLMARLNDVPRGAATVELPGFEGEPVTLELDPALSAVENAEALYDRAKKRERAADRLPDRVREALAEQNRLESLLESLEDGTADPGELARWLEDVRPADGGPEAAGERLPYRRFRSSGGLEIRVGRSGRRNDELTFHHSAPDDIWLHARDAAGAHVILRWPDRVQNPPRRDLVEAAILAAVNSRARSSGTVPVDWTRRKYVRSPRGAPPGAVVPDRVSTVFVEPDPGVEERLADRP